jgi:hypothetical protein
MRLNIVVGLLTCRKLPNKYANTNKLLKSVKKSKVARTLFVPDGAFVDPTVDRMVDNNVWHNVSHKLYLRQTGLKYKCYFNKITMLFRFMTAIYL